MHARAVFNTSHVVSNGPGSYILTLEIIGFVILEELKGKLVVNTLVTRDPVSRNGSHCW
jgi:hypothetical protein